MSQEEKKQEIQKTPEELQKEAEAKKAREERAQRSLKDYWYPQEQGEQNEVLPSLKANVTRASTKTKVIDCVVKGFFCKNNLTDKSYEHTICSRCR